MRTENKCGKENRKREDRKNENEWHKEKEEQRASM